MSRDTARWAPFWCGWARTNEGILELEKALSIQSTDSIAQTNLAMAYEQSGRAAKALPWFCQAGDERKDPKSEFASDGPRRLCACAGGQPAIPRCRDAYERGDRRRAEETRRWHDELGSLYAQQQDWANARKAFSAAIEIDPGMRWRTCIWGSF